MSHSATRATLQVSILLILGIVTGVMVGRGAVARAQDPYRDLDLLARVLTTVQDNYVDDISTEELVAASIEGIVAKLDRHSRWLEPRQLRDLKEDATGTRTGIGVEMATGDAGVRIRKVLRDSPALRSGLSPGDFILAIDGQRTNDLDLDQLQALLDGPRGEPAELLIRREGWSEPKTLSPVRDHVDLSAVETALVQGSLYVRLHTFQEGGATTILEQGKAIADKAGGFDQLHGMVLDLRDNPGGLLKEGIRVSDLFLDQGTIVSVQGRGVETEVHEASPGGFPASLKVAVLVDGRSASASEIVAGALQDTQRATLIGEQTYGKGSVQRVFVHVGDEHHAGLKLTVSHYFTPSGEPVATREGRAPDIEVKAKRKPTIKGEMLAEINKLPQEHQQRLLQLANALDSPTPRAETIDWSTTLDARMPTDQQLMFALGWLKSSDQ